MTIVLNATTGISTPPVTVLGDTSGSISIVAPAVAGTNTQTLLAATGTLAPLIKGTAQTTTSGTSKDFTDIPSWVNRITVMLSGVSVSGTSNPLIQLGTSGGIVNTGYQVQSFNNTSGGSTAPTSFTTGFGSQSGAAANTLTGHLIITNLSGNIWVGQGAFYMSSTASTYIAGGVTLSGTLDRLRITTVNGTDTFDAGSINVLYE